MSDIPLEQHIRAKCEELSQEQQATLAKTLRELPPEDAIAFCEATPGGPQIWGRFVFCQNGSASPSDYSLRDYVYYILSRGPRQLRLLA